MPTTVEEVRTVKLAGVEVKMPPLKIKTLKTFMKKFDEIKDAGDSNSESIDVLVECCVIAMTQYDKEMASVEFIEENFDLDDLYKVVEAAAGIKLGNQGNE